MSTQSEPTELRSHAALRVLVADDEPINRRYLSQLLGAEGIGVSSAEDGRIALDLCRNDAFDLLLLDYRMPGLDGLATLAAIRAEPAGLNRHTPAIVLTAETQATEHARLLGGGFARCLLKPLRASALLAVISELLGRSLPNEARANQALDRDAALRAANGNSVIVATLWGMLKTELEALKLQLTDATPDRLHRARGACRLTGALHLEAALDALESARRAKLDDAAELARAEAALAQCLLELGATQTPG